MWTFAIKEAELKSGYPVRAYPKGMSVLLFRRGESVHALSSQCPHMGCSLGGAVLDGAMLTCPCHDWQFDIVSGRFVSAPEIGLQKYDAKIENEDVLINL